MSPVLIVISFIKLGFSSNVTSDTVTFTNFVKNFNFCGGLYFDSLVAKPLSNLYSDTIALTFRITTNKKSSTLLIYWIKGTVIYTEKMASIINENEMSN